MLENPETKPSISIRLTCRGSPSWRTRTAFRRFLGMPSDFRKALPLPRGMIPKRTSFSRPALRIPWRTSAMVPSPPRAMIVEKAGLILRTREIMLSLSARASNFWPGRSLVRIFFSVLRRSRFFWAVPGLMMQAAFLRWSIVSIMGASRAFYQYREIFLLGPLGSAVRLTFPGSGGADRPVPVAAADPGVGQG